MNDSNTHSTGGEAPSPAPQGPGLLLLLTAGRLLAVFCAYYATARLGLLIPYVGTQVSLVWLPTGIAVAALWRWGTAMLPAVFLAAALANFHVGGIAWVAAGIGLGNACGPWLSAHALRLLGFDGRLLRRQDMAALLLAIAMGMLVTATNGCLWLLLGAQLAAAQLERAWLSWLVGDAVGALLAGVPLVAFSRSSLALSFLGRRGRANSVLQAIVLACGLSIFSAWLAPDSALLFPLLALPFFLIALLALRGGVLASSSAVLLLSMAAAYGTARGHGPFARPDSQAGTLALWSYIAAQACTSLLICGLATELQSSRRQFSALMRHAQDGILVIGADEVLAVVNAAAERMLGLDDSAVGQTVAALPLGNGPLLAALLKPRTAPPSRELVLRGADGSSRDVEVEVARYLDASGYWQTHLVLRDVTQTRQAKARLAASEARLKAITDNLPALISYVDGSQTYRFANAHFRTLMGIEPEHLLGQTMLQFVGAEAHRQLQPHIEAALRGERQKFERGGWSVNAARHFMVDYVPDQQADGAVAGFFIMVQDISERRHAELALARSELRIRTIADNLPAMISHFDREFRYTFANAKVGEVFGCDAASLVGRSIREVRGAEVFADVEPKMSRALAGESISFETFSSVDGRPEYFESNYVPELDAAGEVLGFYALTFEVTRRKQAETQLRESLQLLDRTGTIAGVGGWEMWLASEEVRWTRQTRAIHEVDEDYVPRRETATDFYAPEAREAIRQLARRAIEEGTPWDLEVPMTTARGRPIWVRATGEIERQDGQPVRMFGAFQDVTERVHVERRLREQAELLQVTLKSIGDGVITTDESGRIRWMNPVAERMTGWPAVQARLQPVPAVFQLLDADSRASVPDPVAACLQAGGATGLTSRMVLMSRAGGEHAIEETVSPILDDQGQVLGAVLVFRDVSEQRRARDQLAHRATHDDLTGLVNRAGFEARLERVLQQLREAAPGPAFDRVDAGEAGEAGETGETGVLMFIDLDQFKAVNDACGHAEGDRLLRQASALMSRSMRSRDTLARLGGDEFGVMLERCGIEQARRVAQAICDQMEDFRFLCGGQQFRIGTSIGLAPLDSRWESLPALLLAADQACYAAKAGGRNRVEIWAGPAPVGEAGGGWRDRLGTALALDRFQLHGQAIEFLQAQLGQGGGLHLEALLRLQESPGGPLVDAAAFVPAAERFGLAARLDHWALRRALAWLGTHADGARGIACLALNLSPQSIADRSSLAGLVQLLDGEPLLARKIGFELPERAVLAAPDDAARFIEVLHARGIRAGLDDFGAGGGSLAHLRALRFDWLKLDGRLLRQLPHDPIERATVRCLQAVAEAVGARSIVKCVETQAQVSALAELGVDALQGHVRQRPRPLAELA